VTTGAPSGIPPQIVALAVRTLPAAHRERYRTEFAAELHFVPPEERLGYSIQVLLRTWALRAALGKPTPAPIGGTAMPTTPRAPLSCRLHLWHRWKKCQTEDGVRYLACVGCGKDMSPPMPPLALGQ